MNKTSLYNICKICYVISIPILRYPITITFQIPTQLPYKITNIVNSHILTTCIENNFVICIIFNICK